jgi:hypothetical protein
MFQTCFGRSRAQGYDKVDGQVEAPDVHATVERLEYVLGTLEKRSVYLRHKAAREQDKAREAMRTSRPDALRALARKKRYLAHGVMVDGTRTVIEEQLLALEGMEMNIEAINAMKDGVAAMRSIADLPGLADLADTMADLETNMGALSQIAEDLAAPLDFRSTGEVLDEDALEAELDGMLQEELDREFVRAGMGVGVMVAGHGGEGGVAQASSTEAGPAPRDTVSQMEPWAEAALAPSAEPGVQSGAGAGEEDQSGEGVGETPPPLLPM